MEETLLADNPDPQQLEPQPEPNVAAEPLTPQPEPEPQLDIEAALEQVRREAYLQGRNDAIREITDSPGIWEASRPGDAEPIFEPFNLLSRITANVWD